MCRCSFTDKVAGLRPTTLLKKRTWHNCFPVNFAKFSRTPILQNICERLLLQLVCNERTKPVSFSTTKLTFVTINAISNYHKGTNLCKFIEFLILNYLVWRRVNFWNFFGASAQLEICFFSVSVLKVKLRSNTILVEVPQNTKLMFFIFFNTTT